MIFYSLYRMGHFIACILPLKAAYFIASVISGIYSCVGINEKNAVINNLRVIIKEERRDRDLHRIAKEVFRNFAKYLVDFFRFSKLDEEYVRKFVKIEGLANIDKALAGGKGAILLSAHIGNWELGGIILSSRGYPLSAVVLTHKNKKVNDFFTRQRLLGKIKPIEFGLSLRACYSVLKNNGLLALLGDRDFLKNGLYVDFFGRKALIPKGPAEFSCRLGAAIVPSFVLREEDDTFRFVIEEPIFPGPGGDEKADVFALTKKYVGILEDYIRRYPTQWYVFKKFWTDDEEDLYPDTII